MKADQPCEEHPILRAISSSFSRKDNRLRRIILAVACLSGGLLQGCIFSPNRGKDPPPPPVTYDKPAFPELVIKNLAKAYQQKDSVEYVSLFDANYQGTSIDQFDPTPQLLSVTWADEATHIGALARSAVSSIFVDVAPNIETLRFNDGGDPPGWATIQKPFSRFIVTDPSKGKDFIIPLDQDLIIFKFIPYPGAGTDTTWKIIKWTEVRQ